MALRHERQQEQLEEGTSPVQTQTRARPVEQVDNGALLVGKHNASDFVGLSTMLMQAPDLIDRVVVEPEGDN